MLVICTNMLKLHFKGRRVLQSHDEIFFRSQSFKLLKIYPHFFRQAYNKIFAYILKDTQFRYPGHRTWKTQNAISVIISTSTYKDQENFKSMSVRYYRYKK